VRAQAMAPTQQAGQGRKNQEALHGSRGHRSMYAALDEDRMAGRSLYSPRFQSLTKQLGLNTLLEPYDYGEAEIHSLVKRCDYDHTRIQMEVTKIIEESEHDTWARTSTASEKKVKAQEAKERRLQKERLQEEELERVREQRTKKEDDKLRRLKQELERRKAEENASRLGRREADKGDKASILPKTPGSSGGAWRKSEDSEPAEPGAEAADAEPADEHTAEVALELDEDEEDHEDEEEEEADADAAKAWTAPPWLPENGGGNGGTSAWADATSPISRVLEPAPAAPAPEVEPAVPDGQHSMPSSIAAASPPPNGGADDVVVMPPAYYELARAWEGHEVKFGTLHVLDCGSGLAASSTQPTPQPQSYSMGSWAEEADGGDADEYYPEYNDERSAPRSGSRTYGAPWSRPSDSQYGGQGDGDYGDGRTYRGKGARGGGRGGKQDSGKGGKKGSGRSGSSKGKGGKWR